MRKKIVAGNWKMNAIYPEAEKLVREILKLLTEKPLSDQQVILFPPAIWLQKTNELLENSAVKSGGQNCHWDEKGAFTGEISAAMLRSAGASYVLIGHSERRQYFNESNRLLAKKITAALSHNLVPVYCCGETLEERKSNRHFEVVKRQITEGLLSIENINYNQVVVAYEPVWAIGTGETASPQQAREMHVFIRNVLVEIKGNEFAGNVPLLYGGSCNPGNAKALFSQPDIDGGLIGGASLKAADFVSIIHSF